MDNDSTITGCTESSTPAAAREVQESPKRHRHTKDEMVEAQMKALNNFQRLPDSAGVELATAFAWLNASNATGWRMVKAGILPTYKLGRATRTTAGACRAARRNMEQKPK